MECQSQEEVGPRRESPGAQKERPTSQIYRRAVSPFRTPFPDASETPPSY